MNQLEIFRLFQTTKEERSQIVTEVITRISEGTVNPLSIHLQVKCLEDMLKQLTSSKEYKSLVLDESEKYGKSFEFQNAKFDIREMGVKYDFSNCNDPLLAEMEAKIEVLNKEIKSRQEFLKGVPKSGIEVVAGDELVMVYPPSKSSTTTVSVTLK
jgi:uncharacterized alpha-E superfamily protein